MKTLFSKFSLHRRAAAFIISIVVGYHALISHPFAHAMIDNAPQPPTTQPRMLFGDPSGVDTKDPSVCKLHGKYFLYYSVAGRNGQGWSIGIATSSDLRTWTFVDRLSAQIDLEKKGFCAPGACVIDDKIHLFYQSYGSGKNDAILHAVSDDGIHFTVDARGHVFRPVGDWSSGRAIDAEVRVVGDRVLMYWATRDRDTGSIQMVGISAAALHSDFGPGAWTQLTTNFDDIFRPTVRTKLDDASCDCLWGTKVHRRSDASRAWRKVVSLLRRRL